MIKEILEKFNLIGIGSWSVHSEIDPRWNKAGRFYSSIFEASGLIDEYIDKMELKLGNPPEDLTDFIMKD